MIPYQIVPTTLAHRDRYVARMIVTNAYGKDRLVQRISERYPGLKEPEILRVLAAFQTTVERICLDGGTVNLEGFVRFAPALGGEFEHPDDQFDRKRHQLRVNASISKTFNRNFRQLGQARKRIRPLPGPVLQSVFDLATESASTVTQGNIVTLRGFRLKFDPCDPLDYLRFVHAEDRTVWVAVTRFQRHVPTECVFLMPPVNFSSGYFELANCLKTRQARVSQSEVVAVR